MLGHLQSNITPNCHCYICPITPYKSGDFRLTYSLFLSVTVLRIEETGGCSDMDLVSLMALENLRELKIYADSNIHNQIQSKITFDGGVASLLKAIGNHSLQIRHTYS